MSYGARTMADRFINAAKDGYLDVLQQGTRKDLNTGDEDGMTAVTWAAHNGHLDALRLIVGRGGDVDKSDYLGLTPLHHAAQRGLLHVVTYLVNWGANIYSLDNDHHSALDLASLYERLEVVQYLDSVYAQQSARNPKHVARLREDALRQAEKNAKRYSKLQEEASRRAEKEQRKLTKPASSQTLGTTSGSGVQEAQRKQNLFKTLTLAFRGTKNQRKMAATAGKSYSDIAGLPNAGTARGGVARKLNQRRGTDVNGTDMTDADFKIGEVDESGKRTLSAAYGVRSKTSEVLYMTGQRHGDSLGSAEVPSSRLAVYDVFGGPQRIVQKAKSESDLLDSGVDSYIGDEDIEDEENAPGIFNRPGFGKTAFLTGSNFLNTLPSFDGQQSDSAIANDADDLSRTASTLNGFPQHVNGEAGRNGSGDDSLDDVLGDDPSWRGGAKELPWDEEEVDRLDDDDEGGTSSAVETFLWSAGLEPYLHKFLQEKVDMEVLVKMSDTDLKEIGLPFGPRKKLLEVIKRRHDVLSLPKHMTDSFL